jgi:hypothetical protein
MAEASLEHEREIEAGLAEAGTGTERPGGERGPAPILPSLQSTRTW